MEFTPEKPFKSGETYQYGIKSGAANEYEAPLDKEYSWQFQIATAQMNPSESFIASQLNQIILGMLIIITISVILGILIWKRKTTQIQIDMSHHDTKYESNIDNSVKMNYYSMTQTKQEINVDNRNISTSINDSVINRSNIGTNETSRDNRKTP